MKAQGLIPWAFFTSLVFHALILFLAFTFLTQKSSQKFGQLNGVRVIHASIAATKASSEKIDPNSSVKFEKSPQQQRDKANSTDATETDSRVIASHSVEKSAAISSIPLPSGTPNIWGQQMNSRGNTLQYTIENAQWQARRMEAYRQFSSLERNFLYAPKPAHSVHCKIKHLQRDCTEGAEMFGDFWTSQFAFLYRLDPGFPAIDMHYDSVGGWYAVIQTKLSEDPNP